MFCGNCGKEVRDSDRFCQNCGTVLEHEREKYVAGTGQEPTGQEEGMSHAPYSHGQKVSQKKKTWILIGIILLVGLVSLAVLAFLVFHANQKARPAIQKWRDKIERGQQGDVPAYDEDGGDEDVPAYDEDGGDEDVPAYDEEEENDEYFDGDEYFSDDWGEDGNRQYF